MSTDDTAARIRLRMAELRRELELDVHEVGRGANVITDWKFYVQRFPWAVAGLAALAGYLLVPRRKPVIEPDPEMIQQLVRQNKIKVESVTKQPDKPGMVKSLFMMGLTLAVKAGAQYLTQQIAVAAKQKASRSTEDNITEDTIPEENQPDPSPLHEPWTTTPG